MECYVSIPMTRDHGRSRHAQGDAWRQEGVPTAGVDVERQAFAALYDRHMAGVYRYLYGQTGSREMAEDLTSVTFLRALAAFPRFRADQPFAPWLLRIAHNALIDHRRAATRARRLVERLAGLRAEEARAEEGDAADFLALTQGLPKAQRAAVALRFLAGLDVEEVAPVLGRSPGATRMLLVRALRTLRARAEQEGW